MSPCAGPVPDCAVLHEVSVTLPGDASAPGLARSVVRDELHRWDLGVLVDDAQLAVSELVTNALLHGLPPVLLGLRHQATAVRIDVSDGRPVTVRHEVVATSRAGDESGRGRGIVSSVSDRCGVEQSAAGGKSCYACWDLPTHL